MSAKLQNSYVDPNSNNLKLFIADDQPLIRNWLKSITADSDQINLVGEADTTLKTIRGIRAEKPEVVILDISMPGDGGLHVLSKIKATEPSPIVIIFTSQLEPYYRDLCFDIGADYFFSKTQEFDHLETVLSQLQEAKQTWLKHNSHSSA